MTSVGTDRVELQDVYNAPCPRPHFRGEKRRKMYYPIPHGDVYRYMRNAAYMRGYTITEEAHALTRGGTRYFGLLSLAPVETPPGPLGNVLRSDWTLVIGIRNGHDGIAAGYALGSRVLVCDNLSFSGEVRLARAHTRFIRRDLPGLVQRALGQLAGKRAGLERQIAAYKSTELEDRDAHSLIVRSMQARVIPNARIAEVVEQWENPTHEEFTPRTAWSLFNAFTEVLKPAEDKGSRLGALVASTQKLHGLFDGFCGVSLN
jgi:hypothetical protein